VIEWPPADNEPVDRLAFPAAFRSTGPPPSTVDPSLNVTVPVGAVPPVTVAPKVTV
jgi:hypothetical protein